MYTNFSFRAKRDFKGCGVYLFNMLPHENATRGHYCAMIAYSSTRRRRRGRLTFHWFNPLGLPLLDMGLLQQMRKLYKKGDKAYESHQFQSSTSKLCATYVLLYLKYWNRRSELKRTLRFPGKRNDAKARSLLLQNRGGRLRLVKEQATRRGSNAASNN